MIQPSIVSEHVKPSLTRKLFNMAKDFDDVIDFTLGDPDIQPHKAIKDAGCYAIQEGKTRYSQNAGLLPLRQAISNYYQHKEGLYYKADGEIMVSVGAMEGLYLSLLSILNPGDEVIIPAPYYVNYVQMVYLCHGTPVVVDNPMAGELSFNIEDIEAAITPKTKVIIINTPSNPSAKLIPWDKLEALATMAKRHDLVIISDEVYKCLIYKQEPFRSIATIDGMRERTILINSLSKEFCMTGWRIGYVLAPEVVIATMTKLPENVCACAPLPSQYAAIEALSKGLDKMDLSKIEGTNALLIAKERAPRVREILQRMQELPNEGEKNPDFEDCMANIAYYKRNAAALAEVFTSKGIYFTGGVNSPYIWLKCPDNMGGWDFFDMILNKYGVVGTPGEGFGENGTGYFRLTAFGSYENTLKACEFFKTL